MVKKQIAPQKMDALVLDAGAGATAQSCIVHPVVFFSILDQHQRRHEGEPRVIGECV